MSMAARIAISICAVVLASFGLALLARAEGPANPKKATTTSAVASSHDADTMRLMGEQRYRANCGRCHAAPRKFPPRMMATVLRHMRVRATITDEDMRLVLFYMTQ
jgi:cytochrome c5